MKLTRDELNVLLRESEMEHRKTIRQQCFVPVEANAKSALSDLCTFDIGRGGIGLVSKKKIPIHQQIAVELDLTPEGEAALIMGEVRWVHQNYKTGTYRLGIKFIRILSSGSRSRLSTFLGDCHD